MDTLTQSAVITLGTLGFAVALVVASYVKLRRTSGLADVGMLDGMGGPNWEFSESWATTLATVGGVLNTVLVAGALTQNKVPSGLGAFFGILALLGPFAFSALLLHRLRKRSSAAANAPEQPRYEGCVAGFLVASLLTIWGVSGQIATTITLCSDLATQGALSWVTSGALIACLAFAEIGVAFYAWRTIPDTIETQRNDARERVKAFAAPHDEAELVAPPPLSRSLPRWSVL